MKTRSSLIVSAFVALMIIAGMACAAGATAATSTPRPQPTLTNPSAPATVVSADPASLLDDTLYKHPSETISLRAPSGWKIYETDFDVTLDSEEGAIFYVSVTNTGHELDQDSYERFIQNMENLYYTYQDDFKVTNRLDNDDLHLVVIEKNYVHLNDHKAKFATSLYQQFGPAIFTIEMIGDESKINGDPDIRPLYDAFSAAIVVDSVVAASLPVYQPQWQFTGPQQAFTISVPAAWQWSSDQPAENVVRDQFWSPDELALIESVSLDNGQPSDMKFAGEYALQVLNQAYTGGAGDIKITSDQTLTDGRERLEWTSRKSGYSGLTIFEVRGGTQVLLLSMLWSEAVVDLYKPRMGQVIDTYAIP